MKTGILSILAYVASLPVRLVRKVEAKFGDLIRRSSDNEQHILFDIESERLRWLALHSTERGTTDEVYLPGEQVIVSLTTYGKRMYEVYLTIESMMQQTCKPNKIVLWLQDDYKDRPLPRILALQQARGLEIKYCRDIRSYKKLVPSLREYPRDTIVTIDDDAIYHFDLLEEMLKTRIGHPHCIVCNRFHKVSVNADGTPRPYMEWDIESCDESVSMLCFPTGVGGVMYPPGSLSDEVFSESVWTDLCPDADDVWFKAMAMLKGTLYCPIPQKIHGTRYIDNPHSGTSLMSRNVQAGGNDKAIKAVFGHYGLSF
ncbi:MAG: glycosyltransferase family 2 protein [Prevotella sp.]|nr:glycosyltransferase family 2 protein [Prevotella sp.]